MSLHNEAFSLYEQHKLPEAIELFRQALAENPRPGLKMVINMHLALCIWEQAGLELEGKVYSINEHNAPAAEDAMRLWEGVVNTYKEVRGNQEELQQWPLPGASALDLKNDAASAAFRAYAALERVRGMKPSETTSQAPSTEKKSGGCFIATAAFGSPLAPEVLIFRRFRDEVLIPSTLGKMFVKGYYVALPPVAFLISKSRFLQIATRRVLLQPILRLLEK